MLNLECYNTRVLVKIDGNIYDKSQSIQEKKYDIAYIPRLTGLMVTTPRFEE